MNAACTQALEYILRGWKPIPVPARSKAPVLEGWPKLVITTETAGQYFNREHQNIGVLLGEPSGSLVDVDIDCAEALVAARHLLPDTGSIFGRAGNPSSHHLFISRCISKKFAEPGKDGATLIELRSTGVQTVFPRSVHETGELIEWVCDNGPAEVEGNRLERLVGLTAAAALVARRWPASSRHDTSLALAGALKRSGWSIEQTTLFVRAVAEAARDEQAQDRQRAVVDTYSKDTPTTGWPKLRELLGSDVVGRLAEWLGIETPSEGKAIVEAAIAALDNDAGAMFESPVIKSLQSIRKVSTADYERLRKRLKDKGVRVAELDRLIAGPGSAEVDAGWKPLTVANIDPWPESVDGETILDEISVAILSYLVLPKHAHVVMALWCAHAHVFKTWDFSPKLNIRAPDKGCGKTTARDVVGLFVPKPMPTENLSTPVFFRVIHKHAPTLLVDECDAFLRDNEELRGAINASHQRGGVFYRCEGDDHEPMGYSVFSPVVLAGIKDLPGTIHDRSIVLSLGRATRTEMKEKKRFERCKIDCHNDLNRKLARWANDNLARFKALDPVLPADMYNRVADNWRPLFAIAQIAGGKWPRLAIDAYQALRTDDSDAEGAGIQLLADIRQGFGKQETFFSQQLMEYLHGLEDRAWSEWGKVKKAISKNQVARILKPFRIKPGDIRIEDKHAKGYELAQFKDAFARYLPPISDPHNSSVQPCGFKQNAASGDFQTVRTEDCRTDGNSPKPASDNGLHGCTDRKGVVQEKKRTVVL